MFYLFYFIYLLVGLMEMHERKEKKKVSFSYLASLPLEMYENLKTIVII